jgi:hypothetical protein
LITPEIAPVAIGFTVASVDCWAYAECIGRQRQTTASRAGSNFDFMIIPLMMKERKGIV